MKTAVLLSALLVCVSCTPTVHSRTKIVRSSNADSAIEPRVALEPGVSVSRAGWEVLESPAPTEKATIYFGLTDRNRAAVESLARKVSDPNSKSYGKYLSRDEIVDLVKADQEHIDAVNTWAVENGASASDLKVVGYGDLVKATLPIKTIEKMLAVKMLRLRKIDRPEVVLVRSNGVYTVPVKMQRHVTFVEGVHRLPNVFAAKAEKKTDGKIVGDAGNWPNYCGATCADMITPKVLRQRYNITFNATTGKSQAAVAEFQGQDLSKTDLQMWEKECGLAETPIAKYVGPNNGAAGVESSLDVDVIAGTAPHIPLWFWSLEQYSIYDYLEEVAKYNNDEVPKVASISYGNDEQQNGKDYMEKTNAEFQRLALRGISFIIASGDQGAWGRTGEFAFHPSFPASSPWVTAVGATQFPGANIEHEHCTSWSGGGFSDTFKPESYQSTAIPGYFGSGVTMPAAHYFNKGGRGFPDVSVNGGGNQPYCVVVNGVNQGVMGTSASAPAFASMVALLNDIRAKQNKSPLGFLNPLLYQHPEFFDDITVGKNSAGHFIGAGFEAAKGWDPCSGLGNPSVSTMAAYISSNLA